MFFGVFVFVFDVGGGQLSIGWLPFWFTVGIYVDLLCYMFFRVYFIWICVGYLIMFWVFCGLYTPGATTTTHGQLNETGDENIYS